MRRSLLLLAVLALTATSCDSGGGEIQPLGGLLYVSLQGSTTLLLESNLDLPCGPRIAAETLALGGRFSVTVLGTEATSGACTDVGPVTQTVTIETGDADVVPVDIVFGGFVDEYRYSTGSRGGRLDSVRTSITRLGPRPR